jgi:hypothetical protein
MGGTLSSAAAGQQAQTQLSWLLHYSDSAIKYANYVSLEAFQKDGIKYLAMAYQASEAPHECSQNQHLRFALSKDGARPRAMDPSPADPSPAARLPKMRRHLSPVRSPPAPPPAALGATCRAAPPPSL